MAGGGPNSAPLLGLVGVLFVFTVAELLLSPVGLSVSTKLAPATFHTQMVALFFLSIALGTAMSGLLGRVLQRRRPGAVLPVARHRASWSGRAAGVRQPISADERGALTRPGPA